MVAPEPGPEQTPPDPPTGRGRRHAQPSSCLLGNNTTTSITCSIARNSTRSGTDSSTGSGTGGGTSNSTSNSTSYRNEKVHEMSKLQGKVALVSGSGRGIGLAIAKKLAGEGAAVVVNDLDAEPAQAAAAAI